MSLIPINELFLFCKNATPQHTKLYKYDYILHAFKFGKIYAIFVEEDEGIKDKPPKIINYILSVKAVDAITGLLLNEKFKNLFNLEDIIFRE